MDQNKNKNILLEVKDLQVRFESRMEVVEAVNGISFSLEKGKALGIVGRQDHHGFGHHGAARYADGPGQRSGVL